MNKGRNEHLYKGFYFDGDLHSSAEVILSEDVSHHCVQVLRMIAGDHFILANGKGDRAIAKLVRTDRKKAIALIEHSETSPEPGQKLILALAFTKNPSRNEWLLEKAAEMGVSRIIPLIAKRSETIRIKIERWHSILVSAMIQSKQFFLPQLSEPVALSSVIRGYKSLNSKWVAHCSSQFERTPISVLDVTSPETIVFIGPEGDFDETEIEMLLQSGCTGVSLGTNRLRTETAAMVVASYFYLNRHVV